MPKLNLCNILISTYLCARISYQMRRLKQWEEEKGVLEEGLKAIRGAEDWYESRLQGVSERLRTGADPSATPAANTEAMQVCHHKLSAVASHVSIVH